MFIHLCPLLHLLSVANPTSSTPYCTFFFIRLVWLSVHTWVPPPSTPFFLTLDKWVPLDLSVLPHAVPPFSSDWFDSQCTPGYLLRVPLDLSVLPYKCTSFFTRLGCLSVHTWVPSSKHSLLSHSRQVGTTWPFSSTPYCTSFFTRLGCLSVHTWVPPLSTYFYLTLDKWVVHLTLNCRY